jgi:hypothetical protein
MRFELLVALEYDAPGMMAQLMRRLGGLDEQFRFIIQSPGLGRQRMTRSFWTMIAVQATNPAAQRALLWPVRHRRRQVLTAGRNFSTQFPGLKGCFFGHEARPRQRRPPIRRV